MSRSSRNSRKKWTSPDAVREAAKLPRDLGSRPYAGLMWNPDTHTIRRFKARFLLELLFYMLGRSQRPDRELLRQYKDEVGDPDLVLPDRVV